MNQQNQINQPNNFQEPQQNFQPKKIEKKTILPTWAIILIIVMSVAIIGLVSYSAYQYFTSHPEKTELPMVSEKESTEILVETAIIKYPDSLIFYDYDDQIWQFNPKTEVKKNIADGIRATISPNKTKVAYTYQGYNKHFKTSENTLTGIHIFNITTGKDKLLKYYNKDYPVWGTSWSPNGKYIVVDTGTSPVRSKIVIDSNTGKEIISFTTYHKSYTWISDNEIIFSDLQHIIESRPYGGGEGTGLAIINLNGQKRVLKTATVKKDYNFIQLLNDGKIYFSLKAVESNKGWLDETNQSISYWTIDKFGNNLTQIEIIESLEDKIKKLLPSPYNEYKSLWHATLLTNNKEWTVFVLNKTGKNQMEDEVFIMNINNPEFIKKIGNGICPDW